MIGSDPVLVLLVVLQVTNIQLTSVVTGNPVHPTSPHLISRRGLQDQHAVLLREDWPKVSDL